MYEPSYKVGQDKGERSTKYVISSKIGQYWRVAYRCNNSKEAYEALDAIGRKFAASGEPPRTLRLRELQGKGYKTIEERVITSAEEQLVEQQEQSKGEG